MLKCGYNERNGIVLKLFDSPPQNKELIVEAVINYINHSVDVQKILLYDFKPGNLCRSPFDNNEVVGLDYDPKFCINVAQFTDQPGAVAVMKAYMFLMFACVQYQQEVRNPNRDPQITIALYNGLLRLGVASLLDKILRNPICVNLFKHYLFLGESTPAIEVRDNLQTYIDDIERYATEAQAQAQGQTEREAEGQADDESRLEEKGGYKKKRNKRTRKKTKRRKSRRL
jgi:hypothetical protein